MDQYKQRQIQEELNRIMHMCELHDFSNPVEVENILKIAQRNQLYNEFFGQRFVERLLDIQEGQDVSSKKCIICNREIPENHVVCQNCIDTFHRERKRKYAEPSTPADFVFVEKNKVAMYDVNDDELEMIQEREVATKDGFQLRDHVAEELENHPDSSFSQAVIKEREAEEKLKHEIPKKVKILIALSVCVLVSVFGVIGVLYKNRVEQVAKINRLMTKTQEECEKAVDDEAYQEDMLQQMALLHEENKDCVGWLYVPNTNVSYPVMQRHEDESYYLNHNFWRKVSNSGSLILDNDSNLNIDNANLIVHGHHMKSGEMFGELLNYKDEEYGKKHSIIHLVTEDEVRTYQLFGAFYSQVFYQKDEVFKYYNYFGGDRNQYDEFVENVKLLSCYDTKVDSSYGDEFITLSTCSYHTENGRFVVVGRRVYQ